MSYRCDNGELARIAILMMAALVAVIAGFLGSLAQTDGGLPYVSDNGHVMAPPPSQLVATPLLQDRWSLLGRAPFSALDSIGDTNLRFLSAGWSFAVDGPRAHMRGPR